MRGEFTLRSAQVERASFQLSHVRIHAFEIGGAVLVEVQELEVGVFATLGEFGFQKHQQFPIAEPLIFESAKGFIHPKSPGAPGYLNSLSFLVRAPTGTRLGLDPSMGGYADLPVVPSNDFLETLFRANLGQHWRFGNRRCPTLRNCPKSGQILLLHAAENSNLPLFHRGVLELVGHPHLG